MRKFLKIIGIVVLIILLLLVAVPFVFQGKILKIAKEQLNSSLNAHADFEKMSLSLIRSFLMYQWALKISISSGSMTLKVTLW